MMEAENLGNLVCACQSYQIQLFYKEASIVMALRELKQAKQPIYCLHKGVVMITVFLIDYSAYPSLDSRITSPLQVRCDALRGQRLMHTTIPRINPVMSVTV